MEVSAQVRFLEKEVKAFEKMYREEIERELEPNKTGISIENLTYYPWSSSLENHFYPMSISETGRGLGLILPFRKLIFHSLHNRLFVNSKEDVLFGILRDLSDRRGYGLEYHEFACQHEPIIEELANNKLPKAVSKI